MKISTIIVNVGGIIGADAQFFGKIESGHFYSGNHAQVDMLTEERNMRLKNVEFKETSQTLISHLKVLVDGEEYETWKERGSLYLEDGVTVITENIDFGKSHVNPRVPKGFGDKLYEQVHFNMMLEDRVSPFMDDVLLDEVQMETVPSPWILINSSGRLYDDTMQRDDFLTLLNQNDQKLIRILCESCIASHKEMFYKRLTAVPSDMLDIIEHDWRSAGNQFNVDFKIYSTYNDAILDLNAWTTCGGANDFDVDNHGFPGKCGPTSEVDGQYINMNLAAEGQADVAIYVQNATAPEELFSLPDWENELENYMTSNPDEAKKLGLCWNLPNRDSRRACWRACKNGEHSNNLGALKLCRNLKQKGQIWKSTEYAIASEVEEGEEHEKKIKLTHGLGNDEGLPNLGTY